MIKTKTQGLVYNIIRCQQLIDDGKRAYTRRPEIQKRIDARIKYLQDKQDMYQRLLEGGKELPEEKL